MPAGTFLEVSVVAPAAWQELVAEALCLPGCTGVAIGLASLARSPLADESELVRAFYPEARDGTALRAELGARLAGLAQATGASELAGLAPEFRHLPPEDWAASWRKHWRPLRVGRLCLLLAGTERALRPGTERALRAGDLALFIEPGAAFGTGRHATTRLALAALQARLRAGERVLDVGSGSGILAVAAARLGAAEAVGLDCDPTAVALARELALQNGLAGRVAFAEADLAALPERLPGFDGGEGDGRPADRLLGGFDGLLANLYSDLILAHAGELARRLCPGGWFVVTGCRSERRTAIRSALEAAGLLVDSIRTRGRWDAFAGRRRHRPRHRPRHQPCERGRVGVPALERSPAPGTAVCVVS
jgi:ribosomal protein L11 methyltransferase